MKDAYEAQFETAEIVEFENGEHLISERHHDPAYCAALEAALQEASEALAAVIEITGFDMMTIDEFEALALPISPTVH